VRSRPAEPGVSRYPASARIDSSFACLQARHRAPLLVEGELGMHEAEGVDALLHQQHFRNGCGSSPYTTEARPSVWVAVTALSSRSESVCQSDSARERVGRRPYPGRQPASSTTEVAFPPREGRQSHRARNPGGRLRPYDRVRGVQLSVTSPLHARERAPRFLARAEASHTARTVGRRSHPSEERRCLPPHGRANVPCGGRKRRRYVLPPCS
jgi:hypothetical protein